MDQQAGKKFKYLVLPGNESVLMTDSLQRRPWWAPAAEGEKWNMWFGANGQKFDFVKGGFNGGTAQQVINRLEAHRELTTKSGLAATLARVRQHLARQQQQQQQQRGGEASTSSSSANTSTEGGEGPSSSGAQRGAHVGAWIPETYVLQRGDRAALGKFREACTKHAAAGRKIWIVKPTSMNRGNGIEVFGRAEDVEAHINGKPQGTAWVVQKYIENPLLVDGRKFDIRAYALVAPDGGVFFHREAYIRTSCTPYRPEDLSDRASHLTNDAVQKKLESYNAFEDHCKMSLEELQAKVGPGIDIHGSVREQMLECVRHVFGASVARMNPRGLKHCWELLGMDFMIDADGQVCLIEINTSPALFRAGVYLTDLLPRVVEEAVQKAVDPFFPPPPGSSHTLPTQLDGFQRVDLEAYSASASPASGRAAGAAAASPSGAGREVGGRSSAGSGGSSLRAAARGPAVGPGGGSTAARGAPVRSSAGTAKQVPVAVVTAGTGVKGAKAAGATSAAGGRVTARSPSKR